MCLIKKTPVTCMLKREFFQHNRLKYEEHISLPGSVNHRVKYSVPPRPHSRLTQRDSSRTKHFDGQLV